MQFQISFVEGFRSWLLLILITDRTTWILCQPCNPSCYFMYKSETCQGLILTMGTFAISPKQQFWTWTNVMMFVAKWIHIYFVLGDISPEKKLGCSAKLDAMLLASIIVSKLDIRHIFLCSLSQHLFCLLFGGHTQICLQCVFVFVCALPGVCGWSMSSLSNILTDCLGGWTQISIGPIGHCHQWLNSFRCPGTYRGSAPLTVHSFFFTVVQQIDKIKSSPADGWSLRARSSQNCHNLEASAASSGTGRKSILGTQGHRQR